MDKSELVRGMRVRTKPQSQCQNVASNDIRHWRKECFDAEAEVESVYISSVQYNGLSKSYCSLFFKDIGSQAFFHDWIDGPVALTGSELVAWIRKERHG